MSFEKRWEKKDDPSAYERMKDTIKPSDPLKSRLNESIRRIEVESQRLDQAYTRFHDRERDLLNKTADAYSRRDTQRASIFANEVAELRKIEKMLLTTKLALEQITLRMRTSTELGNIAASLLPVVSVMRELKPGIDSINPQTQKEMGNLNDLLNGMIIDGGMVTAGPMHFEPVDEDSARILSEAQTIAESKISGTFPDIPDESSQPSKN